MAKKIQLTIPKPCHEDWDVMTPQDKGRFCGSCQKQVVDFSNMSDRQVAEFFKRPSTGSVCGRFMTDQLDRSLEIPKKRIPWLKYFFTVALPAFFISLKASGQKTQGTPRVIVLDKDTTRPSIYDDIRVMGMVARPPKIEPVEHVRGEKGRVVDAISGKALPAAQVYMYSTIGKEHIKVATDGSFVLNIYRKITVKSIEISLPGYTTQKLKLADFMKAANSKQPIRLQPEEMIVGKIAMVDAVLPPVQDTIPVCVKPDNSFIKGEIAFVGYDGRTPLKGIVVNENGEPVPFASIETDKMNLVVAGDDGRFELKKEWMGKRQRLVISAVNYESKAIFPAQENYLTGVLYVVLKSDVVLPEVVLTSYGVIKRTSITGQVSMVMGSAVSGIKIENDKDMPVVPIPANNVRVYPNPVPSGSNLNIEWKETEEGYYAVQLLTVSGQSAWQKEIWIDAEARLLNFELPKLAAGSYFLVLTNKRSGKKFTEKIIIQ